MKKFIKKLLREDLEYFAASDATKDEYEIGLEEGINIPSMKMVDEIPVDDATREQLKTISWEDIKISDAGNDGSSIVYLDIHLPYGDFSKGIAINIQLLKDAIYQMHITLAKDLQGLGLGYKIYKALINDLGHLYSGKGRRFNPIVSKVWDKLHKDPDIECYSNENGDICFMKNNPDKQELLQMINMG
jgi:hypothetical protein